MLTRQDFNRQPLVGHDGQAPLAVTSSHQAAGGAAFGQTILTVTHEPRVSSMADRILLLADGLVVQELDHVTSQEVRSAIDALAS